MHAQMYASVHSGAAALRGASPQQRKQLCASQRAQLRSQGAILPSPSDAMAVPVTFASPMPRHMPPLPPALGPQWLPQHAAGDDPHARGARLSRAFADRHAPEAASGHAHMRGPSFGRVQRSAQRRAEGM